MHRYLIFTHHPFQNSHVFGITDLLDEVAATALHVPR